MAQFWIGEFVQPPAPLTLAADVINVTFSRSLWPEKLNAEHLKKKKKKKKKSPLAKLSFHSERLPVTLPISRGPIPFWLCSNSRAKQIAKEL